MMKVCLVFALFFFAFAQVSTICGNDNDCNTYLTGYSMSCENPGNITSARCVSLKKYEVSNTTVIDAKGMCTNSLNIGFGSVLQCRTLGTEGCTATSSSECISSSYNETTKLCTAYSTTPSSNITYVSVGEGQRCSTTFPKEGETRYICSSSSLTCSRGVCRKYLQEGENCFGGQTVGCNPLGNLVCDGDICRKTRSRVAQEQCKVSSVCVELACAGSGVCSERRSIPCYSNSDCPADQPCYVETGKTLGVCSRGFFLAAKNLQNCPSCEKDIIQYYCQQLCQLREDQRIIRDGYTYDCKALTRTAIAKNTCGIKQTVFNCNAPLSSGVVQGLSLIVIIASLLFF